MRRAGLIAAMVLGACSAEQGPLQLQSPGKIRRALTVFNDLGAEAYVVAKGGMPDVGHALERGADGISFSGFVPAGAGDYTLEVVFSGTATAVTGRAFLGRWVSDGFTVVEGEVARTSFSRTLDTVGRPDDGGDADADGFGLLDEILWGTDPAVDDSDGDGVLDGRDCDPASRSGAFTIVSGGTIEDCDGDGERRPDLPYAGAGRDCDDEDPTVNPGATDVCTDDVDQDCNPATCPPVVDASPVITAVNADGGTFGCHARVSATITDDAAIVSASLILPDDPYPGGLERRLGLLVSSGDVYQSAEFSSVAGAGLMNGPQAFEITAQDDSGNTTKHMGTLTFRFEPPTIDSFEPAMIGSASAPFDATIAVTAQAGLRSIRLMAAPRAMNGSYDTGDATELGMSTSSPATITVTPSALADGDWLVYPVVEDAIGNRVQPPGTVFHLAGRQVDAEYPCNGVINRPQIPARVMSTGVSEFVPAKMRALLPRAIQLAAATDPAAVLVAVKSLGIGADGAVALDDAASLIKRWEFAFFNAAAMRHTTVIWLTQAHNRDVPYVDPDAGNVSEEDPIGDPMALVDSDAAAAAFAAAANCPALTGANSDSLGYLSIGGEDIVQIGASSTFWRATATAPITERLACQ